MNPDKSRDQALRRSCDTSLEQALLLNIRAQQNQNGSLPIVSPFLLQRAQPMSLEQLRSTLRAALDLSKLEDLDIDFELDEEFKSLERSVVG
jgi:hypothetical protein